MAGFFYYPNKLIIVLRKRIANRAAIKKLRRNHSLWRILSAYQAASDSTGCSYSDYWTLYTYVRRYRYEEILECGTGISTIVMACALKENEATTGTGGRITSMEDMDNWYAHAKAIIPPDLAGYIDIVLSKRTEYCHSIFRGVGYRDIPPRKYDFVFIDGPGTSAPSDNTVAFDFDYVNVVWKSERPVCAILDKRLGTCYVLQKIFGIDKVRYDPSLGLSFIGPCQRKDIRSKISGKSFSHNLSALRKKKLHLKMNFSTNKSKHCR
jgi:predicted O-methyltransferase YrrM